ncbi:MAG: PorV/PorQ family protein [candidate division WOR-3 bacterium]
MTPLLIAFSLVAIDPAAGTAGFDFLHLAPTAREAALGGAAAAFADGALSFWYSPAHAASVNGTRAHVGYLNHIGGIHYGSAAYAQPIGTERGAGIGVVYLNSGTMKRTDEQGRELGTFGVSYACVNASAATRLIDGLVAGIGLQGLYGSIDTFFALGVAANVGATYRLPVNGLTAGFSAANLGAQAKAFRENRDPMPMDFALGLAWQPNPGLNFALDIHKPLDNRLNFRAGVEGWVADLLVLRGGYNSLGSDYIAGTGEDILAGFSAGLGLRWRGYQIDYGFVPMIQLGMTHRISLSFSL